MKNILDQKPSDDFLNRLDFSASFIEDQDIKDKRILDIGCGFGWFELNASQRGAKDIVAIEISEKDLITAKQSIARDNIRFQVGSAIDLPFENNSFDTVVSWEIIEHIPRGKENKMFSEIRRILKDNGRLYLSTPYKHIISNAFDPAWWLMGHRHYSYEELVCFAENNGLAPERSFVKGGWWGILGVWDLYIAKWIFRRKIFLERFVNNKIGHELKRNKGFTSIFLKFRAI